MHVPSRPYAFNSKKYIDYLLLHSLEQLNLQPTRGTNILELLITNSPETVHNVRCDMGISDHGKLIHAEFNFFLMLIPWLEELFYILNMLIGIIFVILRLQQ